MKTAKFYVFFGTLSDGDKDRLRAYLINPVETREADLDKPATLAREHPQPGPVATVSGFIGAGEEALRDMLEEYGLAMDLDDLRFMQSYFRDIEKRDPTVTEIRLVDTYWSDHCRHTTFLTHLDSVEIEDEAVRRAYERYLEARRGLGRRPTRARKR